MFRARAISSEAVATDRFLAAYVHWRAACQHVRLAYAGWARSGRSERGDAYLSYRLALHDEESAARAYADRAAHLREVVVE